MSVDDVIQAVIDTTKRIGVYDNTYVDHPWWKKSGNIFRVGIFLDFVWLTTSTEGPHGAYVRGARRSRIDRHRGGIEWLRYFMYSSDHGFQLGEMNLAMDKRNVYDFDVRIHLVYVKSRTRATLHGWC